MPLHAHHEFPLLTWVADGQVDYNEGLAVAEASLAHAQASGLSGWHILSDLRTSQESRSADELRAMAVMVGNQRPLLSGRLAILTGGPLVYGTSRMFQVFAEVQGVEVQIFSDEAKARSWLLAGNGDLSAR